MEYRLVCRFLTAEGTTISHAYKFSKSPENITAEQVNALMTATITNGSIFTKTPVSKKDAYVEATQKTSISVTV